MGLHLDDREIGQRVLPDELGRRRLAVVESHEDFVGLLNDVVVGEDVSVCPYDDAGTERTRYALGALACDRVTPLPEALQLADRRSPDKLRRVDIDHGRPGAFDRRCITGLLRNIPVVGEHDDETHQTADDGWDQYVSHDFSHAHPRGLALEHR